MTLQLVQSEDFLLDLESQFPWYIHQSKLELSEAVELAQQFKIAVLETLHFLLKNRDAGPKRFPQYADLEGTRFWRVSQPFNRFLIYYHVENNHLMVDRLIEGHRRLTTDIG